MKPKVRVDIVTPVYYKEAQTIVERILKQFAYCTKNLTDYDWKLVIANNGLKKDVREATRTLIKKYPRIRWSDTDNQGRGWSLAETWLKSDADLFVYMDADLATNMNSLHPMIHLLKNKEADIAIGSRYIKGANASRTLQRLILSKTYNLLLNTILGLNVKDAQCGFKGITRKAVQELIPLTKDRKFFFDTELLYYGQLRGYTLVEIPVEWTEQEETSVHIVHVTLSYLAHIFRLWNMGKK